MTTALLPDRDTQPAVRRTASNRAYLAPQRFDVHEVADFEAWVEGRRRAGRDHLIVDCSEVVFIDMAAIAAIERAHEHTHVSLYAPSLATRITLDLVAGASPARHRVAA